ncbi:N-acyl-D-glucosamine 2-epimerase [bacterium]|nr:N-acyl-D-glucosamine 2-epimerase [bacterium]
MPTSPLSAVPVFNQYFTQTMTIQGAVAGDVDVDSDPNYPDRPVFVVRLRSGDRIPVALGKEAYFQPVTNLDGINRDRYPTPDGFSGSRLDLARKYLVDGVHVAVEGVHHRHGGKALFEARAVHLLQQTPAAVPAAPKTDHEKEMSAGGTERRFYFEFTYWWLNQIQRLADKWLDDLFQERRDYQLADFAALYRTNLNIVGEPTDDNTQEMATLSRLIYGLSSAYLLNGVDRYYYAARAGVQYQREAFRGTSADGRYCFWSASKRRMKHGSQYVMTSQNSDDYNTIPLYEQIYALAGLNQFYRITNDKQVLDDIRRTVRMFQDFFRDKSDRRGYYSHLDYVTFSPRNPSLGNNTARKNWNSIGDHIPAYLINLILALEPVPAGRDDLVGFLQECKDLLKETTALICDYFPQTASKYVQERFYEDWKHDTTWGWQQNRGVVGHNLKISWNLTRAANYFYGAGGDPGLADKCMQVAHKLAKDMAWVGLDPVRGGCFDCVERIPRNGMPVEFAWLNTKDFWQQEQAILAYLIMHGNTDRGDQATRDEYQQLAREMMTFWNLFFLDRDNQGVFFRTTENGQPVVSGGYANKAGHSIAGYHSFELNYLAHIYLRSYFERPVEEHQRFTLYFRPDPDSRPQSINVLPDFFKPGKIEITSATIDGVAAAWSKEGFQVSLKDASPGARVVVEFQPRR